MSKSFYSLGLMSGTSADGVDASVIQSDGDTEYKAVLDRYFKYDQNIFENIHNLKEEINDSRDLNNSLNKIQLLEKDITIFHAKVVEKIKKDLMANEKYITRQTLLMRAQDPQDNNAWEEFVAF